MTVQLPGDLKGEGLGDEEPIEELAPVADVAPTLIEKGIPESKLQQDWKPKTPPAPPAAAIPAHHYQQAYNKLQQGSTVEEAAAIAAVPLAEVEKLAAEVAAVCTKLGSEVPENVKPKPKAEPGPVEPPVEEPVG